MLKKVIKTSIITLSAFTVVFLLAQCNKDTTDNSNGCLTEIYFPIDSAHVPPVVMANDSFAVEVFSTATNYCYMNYRVTRTGSNNVFFYKAFADYNGCVNCAQATKVLKASFMYYASQPGTWSFTFQDTTGNFTKTVTVN